MNHYSHNLYPNKVYVNKNFENHLKFQTNRYKIKKHKRVDLKK